MGNVVQNKYEVQEDAIGEAEVNQNFPSQSIILETIEVFQCWYPFRGECKADFHMNLLRQFLHSKSPFWSKKSWILTWKGYQIDLWTLLEIWVFQIKNQSPRRHQSSIDTILARHQSSLRYINHLEESIINLLRSILPRRSINQSNPKKSIKS